MTDSTHTLTHTLVCIFRDRVCHTHTQTHTPHFHSCLFFSLFRQSNRSSYCTEPARRKNISILGKEQPPLYGEASSVVTTPSPGFSFTFLLLQVSLGAFHFRFAGWRKSRAAFHKSLAQCVILLFQKKKIHKPSSSLFPAIFNCSVWCSKISLAGDRAHLAFHRLNLIRQVRDQRTCSLCSRRFCCTFTEADSGFLIMTCLDWVKTSSQMWNIIPCLCFQHNPLKNVTPERCKKRNLMLKSTNGTYGQCLWLRAPVGDLLNTFVIVQQPLKNDC